MMDAKEGEKEFIRRLQQQSLESIRHHQDSIQAKIKLLADKEMELQGARNSHRHTMNMLMVEESRTERLKQQLAEAMEQNRWIPISERLPEDTTLDYLIWTANKEQWLADWIDKDRCFYVDDFGYFSLDEVELWKIAKEPQE